MLVQWLCQHTSEVPLYTVIMEFDVGALSNRRRELRPDLTRGAVHGRTDIDRPWMDEANKFSKRISREAFLLWPAQIRSGHEPQDDRVASEGTMRKDHREREPQSALPTEPPSSYPWTAEPFPLGDRAPAEDHVHSHRLLSRLLRVSRPG